jgi:hypothetical protein
MTPRELILLWVGENGFDIGWLLRVYLHLIDSSVAPDDAIAALDGFINDIISMKESAA